MKLWDELNYKEKFIRTLIMIPFAIIACIICSLFLRKAYAIMAIVVVIVTLIWQLIYTYTKWKNGE